MNTGSAGAPPAQACAARSILKALKPFRASRSLRASRPRPQYCGLGPNRIHFLGKAPRAWFDSFEAFAYRCSDLSPLFD